MNVHLSLFVWLVCQVGTFEMNIISQQIRLYYLKDVKTANVTIEILMKN